MAGRISLYVRLQKVTLYLSIKKRLRSFRRRILSGDSTLSAPDPGRQGQRRE